MPLAIRLQENIHTNNDVLLTEDDYSFRLERSSQTSSDPNVIPKEVSILSELQNTFSQESAPILFNDNGCLKKTNCNANDYVIVKFCTKKFTKHYIGVVQSTKLDDYPNDYLIKFLKKKTDDTNKFFFPDRDDVSLVDKTNIVTVLPSPTIGHRGYYIFDSDLFKLFNNLN